MSWNRRQVLRGAAATLWLPLLPSALPRAAWGSAADPRKRMVVWFVPNGLLEQYLNPSTLGSNYDLTTVIEPIAPIQDRISVLSKLKNMGNNGSFGTHEDATASLLTDVDIGPPFGDIKAGISVDQVAANAIAGQTPFPSMQLGCDEPWIEAGGTYDIYYNHISWASNVTPLAPMTSPRLVFDRMFAGADSAATAEEIAQRNELRRSLLDSMLDRTASLEARLNAEDRIKLDQYTTGIRELELRIDQLEALECPQPETPADDLKFPAVVQAMSDLMVLALQCDYTRIFTFMTGASTSETVYSFLDINRDHHTLSHNWTFDNSADRDLKKLQNWHVQKFTELCQALADTPDVGGDMLSSTTVLLAGEFGESNLHDSTPFTVLLGGGEASGIVQGKHRACGNVSHGNLLRSMLDHMDVDSSDFGDHATGSLDLYS